MAQGHIAIVTSQGQGHVYPVLGLCCELKSRGYRVTYAATERYASQISAAGAEPVSFAISPKAKNVAEEWKKLFDLPPQDPRWWSLHASLIFPWLLDYSTELLSQVEGFYRENPPDVILYDRIAYAGRILAKRLQAPAIQIFPHFAYYKHFMHRDNGICMNPPPMLEFAKQLDSFFAAHGFSEKNSFWHSEELNIYFLPKEFQYEAEYFNDRSQFVGACLDRPFASRWVNRSEGKPIILISDVSRDLGEGSGYFSAFVAALSELNCHVILSIGKDEQIREALGNLPANFEINQYASHLEILPHTTLSICQAGMGSTLEALYNGVPVIAMPPSPQHEEVAFRIAELGLGIHLPRSEVTTDVIRETVTTALADEALLARVKRMQQVFQRYNGSKGAADLIEKFLRQRRRVAL